MLVNHCSDRRPDIHPCGRHNRPNAQYRWAKWDEATDTWLNKTIAQMEQDGGRGLSMEIVATRDIEVGEEVFVDYGVNWEEAWDKHLQNWKPPTYDGNPEKEEEEWTSATKLNKELLPLKLAPNLNAEHISLDSRNVLFTGCLYHEDDDGFWRFVENEGGNNASWENQSIDELITGYGRPYGKQFKTDEDVAYSDGSFWPCVVFRREISISSDKVEESYTVRITQSHVHETTVWEKMKLPCIISSYPRASIRHFYKPYESDIHLPGVFRHHIELVPEDMFPEIWKDRK